VTGDRPVPGTGPYRVARYDPKRRVRLVRNQYFRVWSKAAQPEGFPDEIALEIAGTRNALVTAVAHGRADWVWSYSFPGHRLQEARTRYAAQLHLSPALFTVAVRLDTKRPPFDDVRARRAVAYAFDRQRLVNADGGAVTCQLLPPNVPAYSRYCPYTVGPTEGGAWTAPDLGRARRLVAESGTQGMRVDVLGTTEQAGFASITTILDETLRRLGYQTSVRRVRGDFFRYADAYTAGVGRVEAAPMGWIGDYPTPANFMIGLLACFTDNPYGCDPNLDRKLRQTLELQGGNVQAANDAWVRLEREVVDQAIIVPVFNPPTIDFVSKRLGNYQSHPLLGMLLSQVWVR
jgi:peptide/nickel transport system substrate-binding protein